MLSKISKWCLKEDARRFLRSRISVCVRPQNPQWWLTTTSLTNLPQLTKTESPPIIRHIQKLLEELFLLKTTRDIIWKDTKHNNIMIVKRSKLCTVNRFRIGVTPGMRSKICKRSDSLVGACKAGGKTYTVIIGSWFYLSITRTYSAVQIRWVCWRTHLVFSVEWGVGLALHILVKTGNFLS